MEHCPYSSAKSSCFNKGHPRCHPLLGTDPSRGHCFQPSSPSPRKLSPRTRYIISTNSGEKKETQPNPVKSLRPETCNEWRTNGRGMTSTFRNRSEVVYTNEIRKYFNCGQAVHESVSLFCINKNARSIIPQLNRKPRTKSTFTNPLTHFPDSHTRQCIQT